MISSYRQWYLSELLPSCRVARITSTNGPVAATLVSILYCSYELRRFNLLAVPPLENYSLQAFIRSIPGWEEAGGPGSLFPDGSRER